MISIGVIERKPQLISKLRTLLKKNDGISIEQIKQKKEYSCILIGGKCVFPSAVKAKILVAPDSSSADELSTFCAEEVISYGLCKKNTITASSLVSTRLVVSIQREIKTFDGNILGEQEFSVKVSQAEKSDELLGIIAVLLLSGISPEKICEI